MCFFDFISTYLSHGHPHTGFMVIMFQKTQMSILFLFLLLCSVGIAPVMAARTQTEVVEDSVHLVKFDTSPTELNYHFYDMRPQTDFVVDGNQFYWVRIGNVVSEGLTTVWWAKIVSLLLLFAAFVAISYLWILGFARLFPKMTANIAYPIGDFGPVGGRWTEFKHQIPLVFPVLCTLGILYCVFSSGVVAGVLTHAVCDGFVDLQASDGTILLKVDKLHPETSTLYMKSGINLTTLTHLSGSGNILNLTGAKLT